MIVEFIFLILCLYLYFLFYTHIKINKHNSIYLYNEEITKQNINNEIKIKKPFYFNGIHLNDKINKKEYILIEKGKNTTLYKKNYESMQVLEPYIKFNVENNIYYIEKNKYIDLHSNPASSNFYIIKKGKCKISFIHPNYKDNFYKKNKLQVYEKTIQYIKENNNFNTLECYANTIIYVPNHWFIYIENINSKQTIVEKIQYKTIIDDLIFFTKKVFNKKQ